MRSGASERARTLDEALETSLESITLPASRVALAQVRTYLLDQNVEMGARRNNVQAILKIEIDRDLVFITLGPSFDKGPTTSHFHLKSGARWSFGITLRATNQSCSLIAYRFQLNLPEAHSPSFYRFDLNSKGHHTPLLEPRCHFHPGAEEVRLPCPALTPLEVLDRIFFVIEPQVAVMSA